MVLDSTCFRLRCSLFVKMTASDFGYKFLDRELNRRRYDPANLPTGRQGPRQMQTRYPASDEPGTPFRTEREFRRSQVLPEVFDILGAREVDTALNRQDLYRGAAERQRLRELEGGPEMPMAVTGPIPEVSPYRELNPAPRGYEEIVQEPITGLNRSIQQANQDYKLNRTAALVDKFENLVERYPELQQVLDYQRSMFDYNRPIKGKEFGSQYTQFADIEQVYSDPIDRAKLYSRLKQTPEGSLYNFASIESDYASGDTSRQFKAIEDLLAAGATPDELAAIQKPAFQENRPVVGGGSYVDPSEDLNLAYIDKRANLYNDLVREAKKDPDIFGKLIDLYPGLSASGGKDELKFFAYDDEGKIIESDQYDENAYGVEVTKGSNYGMLAGKEQLPDSDVISSNALRFLGNNPAFYPQSVSFKTSSPDEYMSYEPKDIPDDILKYMNQFVQEVTFSDNRPGTLLTNEPIGNEDIVERLEEQGKTTETSSTLRKLEPFRKAGYGGPNLRGLTYSKAGFGPVSGQGLQTTYVDSKGRLVPLQLNPSDVTLAGRVRPRQTSRARLGEFEGTPTLPYKATPRYYASLLPGMTPETVNRIAGNIKRTPSSLLPGVSDLVPSAEAVRRGYQEGPQAMGQQMVKDFAAGIPISATLAPILSAPAVAPFAPGIGGGLMLSAGAEALNEAVKQQTGKGLGTRIQETAGAIGGDTRYFGTPKQRGEQNLTLEQRLQRGLDQIENPPQITQGSEQPKSEAENFLERRLRLAKEARQSDSGDFGVTELLFGR